MAEVPREREAIDEVLRLLGSMTNKKAVVRMTNTSPLLISVLDVIQSVKGGSLSGTRAVWTNLKDSHPEVCDNIIFQNGNKT